MANFMDRHSGISPEEQKQMLEVIGCSSLEELISKVVPADIRLRRPLDLPKNGMSEYEFANHIRQIAAKNRPLRTFIGMGYYPNEGSAAIMRNIFENPSWYTSYTPYQAEISQGRLEALLNFQTMICSMTGMEISNCSLLDEATSAAEAMTMMYGLRSREAVTQNRNILFVDSNIFPQTLDLLLTRSEPQGIEIVCDNFTDYEFTGREFGAIVQYPAASGEVRDYDDFCAAAHGRGILVTAAVDLLALALLKSPAEWGADIVVGNVQRFGLPMGFGGPHAGYLATKEAYKRSMPGRIIGESIDRLGNRALRMALQTREQHIKRERATSNICTSQALMAIMAGMYAVYHGPKGILAKAQHTHLSTVTLAESLREMGYSLASWNFFDTIEVVDVNTEKVEAEALKQGINLYYLNEGRVHISLDEVTTIQEINTIISVFAKVAGVKPRTIKELSESSAIARNNQRTTPFLQEQIFNTYSSETELMRYIKMLEHRDISLADSMISLGSCTMKLNAAVTMMPLSLAEFGNIHPFVPADQAEGSMEIIRSLEHDLAIITGFDGVSVQPNSGANGEYSGLMVIRAYHQSRGQGHRNIALIPASAHGTNPASAAMAGMKVVVVACDQQGNIDLEDLRNKAQLHAPELSCLVVTYPSTHGVFESRIREMIDIVHDNGGQVYMDGANMNAQVGLTSPGYIGADVCHLNLHKTFAMPHGGGGPGVGPICVAAHLTPFLPSHAIVATGGKDGITATAAAPFGSALLLPITYAYIKMSGEEGLRRATSTAILNANYMSAALKGEYETLYTGSTGCVGHEMILDLRNFRKDYGVDCSDIARRLMDYGFHAPTLSFPVHETLMVEPTESECKAEMDDFMDALIRIKRECEAIATSNIEPSQSIIANAPHTAAEIASDEWNHPYSRMEAAMPTERTLRRKFFPYVTKIDAGYGDRNLVCKTC